MPVRVIGVGTGHGDDAAGLEVARQLARQPLPPYVSVVECQRPGLDLLEQIGDADAVVLVDAVRSDQPAGTVHRIPLRDLRPRRDYSSHSLGVAEALQLAAALGRLPRRVEIVGIEGKGAAQDELSPAVQQGVRAAVTQVITLIDELGTPDRRYKADTP